MQVFLSIQDYGTYVFYVTSGAITLGDRNYKLFTTVFSVKKIQHINTLSVNN